MGRSVVGRLLHVEGRVRPARTPARTPVQGGLGELCRDPCPHLRRPAATAARAGHESRGVWPPGACGGQACVAGGRLAGQALRSRGAVAQPRPAARHRAYPQRALGTAGGHIQEAGQPHRVPAQGARHAWRERATSPLGTPAVTGMQTNHRCGKTQRRSSLCGKLYTSLRGGKVNPI